MGLGEIWRMDRTMNLRKIVKEIIGGAKQANPVKNTTPPPTQQPERPHHIATCSEYQYSTHLHISALYPHYACYSCNDKDNHPKCRTNLSLP